MLFKNKKLNNFTINVKTITEKKGLMENRSNIKSNKTI